MAKQSEDSFKSLFPQRHIPVILGLTLKVGKNVHKQSETDREDWLTTRLHRHLIREPTFRDGPLHVSLQPEIVDGSVDPDTNTVEGRLDLQFTCGNGYEVYFAIEAKRLRVSLPSGLFSGNSEYVSEGMMRFVTGQYAPYMQCGAMLGYVYDGDKKKARSGIDRQIQKRSQDLKIKEPKKLIACQSLNVKPVHETIHDLGTRYFTIYHLFLAV